VTPEDVFARVRLLRALGCLLVIRAQLEGIRSGDPVRQKTLEIVRESLDLATTSLALLVKGVVPTGEPGKPFWWRRN